MGEAEDIDYNGFLIVRDNQGNMRRLMSADIEI